jgi:hypothetical protein
MRPVTFHQNLPTVNVAVAGEDPLLAHFLDATLEAFPPGRTSGLRLPLIREGMAVSLGLTDPYAVARRKPTTPEVGVVLHEVRQALHAWPNEPQNDFGIPTSFELHPLRKQLLQFQAALAKESPSRLCEVMGFASLQHRPGVAVEALFCGATSLTLRPDLSLHARAEEDFLHTYWKSFLEDAPTFLANASTQEYLDARLWLAKGEADTPGGDFPFKLQVVTLPAAVANFSRSLVRARTDFTHAGRVRAPGPSKFFAALAVVESTLRRLPCAFEAPVASATSPSRLIAQGATDAFRSFLCTDPIFTGVFLGILRVQAVDTQTLVLGLEPRFMTRVLGRRIAAASAKSLTFSSPADATRPQ